MIPIAADTMPNVRSKEPQGLERLRLVASKLFVAYLWVMGTFVTFLATFWVVGWPVILGACLVLASVATF